MKPSTCLPCGIVLSAIVLAGCGSTQISDSRSNSDLLRRTEALRTQEQVLASQQKAIVAEQQTLRARNEQLAEREAQLQAVGKSSVTTKPLVNPTNNPAVAVAGESGGKSQMQSEPLLPPQAKPGECYARVYRPPQYKTTTEKLLKRAESSRMQITPARYESATEEVLVRPETKKLRAVPPVYEWVTERVLVSPATKRLVEVPAQMAKETERVMVRAGYTTWKKGTGPIQKIDQTTGEIMCLVEVAPVYKNITKTVQKAPASVRTIDVPAVYKTVRKQVLKTPATTRDVVIPAQYKTVKVAKLVEPARESAVPIPAQYQTVERREMVSAGGLEWRAILCETNMTRERVADIQRALQTAGHNPGPIDGVIARRTMQAVNAYQKEKGLPVDRYLNMETVRSLGVIGN